MTRLKIFCAGILMGLCCSCSGGCYAQTEADGAIQEHPFSVVNWNTQTFFDANRDGCEYEEFQKAGDWNKEKYQERIRRLCQVISTLDADLFILEEIENDGVLLDIANELSGKQQGWNQKKFWNYSLFAKEEGSAIGIGFFSRFPLSEARTHSMDVRIHKEKQPAMRHMIEAYLSIADKKVVILANHWKSKVGGEEENEIWRDWQENILARRLSELKKDESITAAILCGDFNRDAADFICNFKSFDNYIPGEANTIFRYALFGYTDYTSAESIWFTDSGNYTNKNGSYFYDDDWERIDNILVSGKIKILDSEPCAIQPWASVKGYPIAYRLFSGEGYSDHLPVMARLAFTD